MKKSVLENVREQNEVYNRNLYISALVMAVLGVAFITAAAIAIAFS